MSLEAELRALLAAHRYESQAGLGQRGLMQHHIDALVATLMPWASGLFNAGVEAVAVASASCSLPKPYYRGELAAKIRACKQEFARDR